MQGGNKKISNHLPTCKFVEEKEYEHTFGLELCLNCVKTSKLHFC